MEWTLPVKPCGGSHLAIASGSRNARYTRSAGARSTRWSRMVFAEFDISSLSFEVRDRPGERVTLVSFIRRTSCPRIDTHSRVPTSPRHLKGRLPYRRLGAPEFIGLPRIGVRSNG